jgi:hypothetical protein
LARSYHVAKSGKDNNPGTEGRPFLTIGKAANAMKPGDTTIVAAGNYPERIRITRSGKQGSPFTFEARGKVVMEGFTLMANYARVIGFEITNKAPEEHDGAGVYLEGNGNEVLNNYIHDIYFEGVLFRTGTSNKLDGAYDNLVKGNRIVRARIAGIHIEGQNNRVERNDISHILQYPKGAPAVEGADADGIRFFGAKNLIRRNSIHDILKSDKGNRDPHIDCFQSWGPASRITFDGNLCNNPNTGQQGWMIWGTDIHRLTMRNNVMKAFRLMYVRDVPWLTVANNSFKGEPSFPGTTERGYGIELHGSPNARIQNNLFYDVGGHIAAYMEINDQASKKGLIAGYNAAYMSDGKRPAGSPRAHDLWQKNPRVMDSKNLDFRVKPGSPLIDVGVTLENVKRDREGVARPQGTRHDIGAYEVTL